MPKRELLRRVRAMRGLSQIDLAKAAKVTPSTMCRIENGRADPWQPEAERIAKALGWQGNVAELFREDMDEHDMMEVLQGNAKAAKGGGCGGGYRRSNE